MGKIFEKYMTGNILTSKIHKQLTHLKRKKAKYQIKKMAEDLNGHFPKEDTQMATKHIKGAQRQ